MANTLIHGGHRGAGGRTLTSKANAGTRATGGNSHGAVAAPTRVQSTVGRMGGPLRVDREWMEGWTERRMAVMEKVTTGSHGDHLDPG